MTVSDKEPFAPALVSQADVEEMWRTVMHPLGWQRRALWFSLVGADDRPLPRLCEVTDLPDQITREAHAAAAAVWRELVTDLVPGGRIALLLARPGTGGPRPADRALAGGIYAACRAAGVATEVIHLATDDDVWPLPADEVLGRSG